MKIQMHYEIDLAVDHPFCKLLLEQTLTFMKGKAIRLRGDEVPPEIVALFTKQGEDVARAAEGLIASGGIIWTHRNTHWESTDLVPKQDENALLAPEG